MISILRLVLSGCIFIPTGLVALAGPPKEDPNSCYLKHDSDSAQLFSKVQNFVLKETAKVLPNGGYDMDTTVDSDYRLAFKGLANTAQDPDITFREEFYAAFEEDTCAAFKLFLARHPKGKIASRDKYIEIIQAKYEASGCDN